MADLPNRLKLEKKLQAALRKSFRPWRSPKRRRMPGWQTIRKQLLAAIHPQLERVRVEAARNLTVQKGDEPFDEANLPPSNRAAEMVDAMIEHSKAEWHAMKKPRSKKDIVAWQKTHLGKSRIEKIAATEITMAQSSGELAAASQISKAEGKIIDAMWMIEPDACEICRPLRKKPRSVWQAKFPGGPPAHPRCRCWLEFKKKKAKAKKKI